MLLQAHSGFRYLVLLMGLVVIGYAAYGLVTKAEYGKQMRVLSAITDPDVARRILDCLRMPSRAPPLAAAEPRAEKRLEEPSSELDWGHDPGFDFEPSGPGPE